MAESKGRSRRNRRAGEMQRDAFPDAGRRVGRRLHGFAVRAPCLLQAGSALVESEGFPIAGYDELNVKEIGDVSTA